MEKTPVTSALLETLASYVPGLVVRHLATDSAPITTPTAENFPAAVLFADISGFTFLAERLAQHGPVGAEELTRLLNAYFGQLIDLVTAHGGDIVKFAGDALLALWPTSETEDLATVARRAAQCGLAIQATLHDYEVAGRGLDVSGMAAEEVRLSLRVGIGAGEVFTVYIGGVFKRWEFLITGAPTVQMSIAEQQAQPGQVVLSPETWALVGGQCTGILLHLPPQAGKEREGYVRLEAVHNPLPPCPISSSPLVPEMETALRTYIPAAIRSRLDAGQTGWLAELRPVTVLFLNLPDLDHTTSLKQAQRVMRILQTTLYHYEGSINKLNVDDKGATLVAVLGLPPLAHEDDAVRGTQAALAMQAKLRELCLRSAIGVTTGRAFCGSVGNATRREYTVVGDVVNVAARLMQVALDDILCDEATYQAAQTRLAFEPLPAIMVKGKTESVAVYHPLSEAEMAARLRQRIRRRATIIGRTAERAILTERLDALLSDSAGGRVVVEGEAGIGKSRLVEDALQQAQALGVTCLIGGGDAIEKSTPYHAWRPVFRQLFNLDELFDDAGAMPPTEVQRRHVLAQLESNLVLDKPVLSMVEEAEGLELSHLVPLLNAVLPLDLPENELTEQMTGQVRANNTHKLLLRLLQVAANQTPTLLVLEDAHWLDSASWALTHLVSQDIRSMLLVIATRPLSDPAPLEYRQLFRSPDTRQLLLEALPPEDTLTLVCQRLGVATLPEPVAALIREKAEGHPFFSEELAYALRDAGLILIADGECHIAPDTGDLSGLSFPDTVQGVVTSRIDRLTPSQQLTLKVASVIGRVFAFRVLRDVHPIEADKMHLTDYLNALERLDITPLETPEPDLSYIFKHIITREVAYNLMLFAQRRELHRVVAEWYERTYTDDLTPFYPLLAYHWGKTEVAAKAIDYLEKAGEQALHNFANQEAINFFSQAVTLDARLEPGSDRLRRGCWERQLGQAYWGLGQLKESREHFHRAAALLGRPMPVTRGRLVASLLGQVVRQLWHRLRPARPSASPEVRTILLETARAYEHLAEISYHANERALVIYASLRALNLAERVGPCLELALAYANMCIIAGLIPLHSLAEAYGRRARETAQNVNQLDAQEHALRRTSIYYAGVGQWDKAQEFFEGAVAIADRLGNQRVKEEGLTLLGWVVYYRSQFVRSQELFTQVYDAAHRSDNTLYKARGLSGQALNALRLGQLDEVIALVQRSLDLFTEDVDRIEETRVYAVLAVVSLYQGDPQSALQAAEKAGSLIAESGSTSAFILEGYAGVAEVYLTLWEANETSLVAERQDLARAAQQACAALRQFARRFSIGQPRTWLYQGWADWLAGQPGRAKKAWEKSLSIAARLSMPYEQGLAHYEIGRHLDAQDPAWRIHLTRACEIFEQLGAAYDLARAQATLGSR